MFDIVIKIASLTLMPAVLALYLARKFRLFFAKLIFVPFITALFTFMLSLVVFAPHYNEEDIGLAVAIGFALFYQIILSIFISVYYYLSAKQ